jgi:hypothetical protein
MNTIFLDVDGVLNKLSDYEVLLDGGYFRVNTRLLERFLTLVKNTNSRVVLSSSWRKLDGGRDFLEKLGIKFVGETDGEGILRGEEIQRYIDAHSITSYIILDDDSDMLEHQKPYFIQTDPEYGLTNTLAYRAAYKLGVVDEN